MMNWMRLIFSLLVLSMGQITSQPLAFGEEIKIEQPASILEEPTSVLEQPISIKVSLISEEKTIQPNHPFWVAIRLQLDDNWHAYWKNPGDSGMATKVDWKLPEGFTASPLVWPTPEHFDLDGMIGYGYKGEFILLSQITPSSSYIAGKPPSIGAEVTWLICSDSQCVPGKSDTNTVTLSMTDQAPKINNQWTELFTKARANVPVQMSEAEAFRDKDTIQLYLHIPEEIKDRKNLYFFPEETRVIDHKAEASLTPSPDYPDYQLVVLKSASASSKHPAATSLKGVFVVKGKPNDANAIAYAGEVNVPIIPEGSDSSWKTSHHKADTDSVLSSQASQALSNPNEQLEGGLAMAILLAFAGGMILNLMPCVLPVVSFKILSFVNMANKSRALTLKHGLAFFLGVLASFWALAGALIILQQYGQAVGWGFQLQDPLFVAILSAILLTFGLSMFGLFELGSFATNLAGQVVPKEELSGSFLSGILATVVATPCTGPFLGTAVGFAFTVSAPATMLIFTFLGLGMALPYLILAAFPTLLRFLPRPGSWMDTFKQVVGFTMVATVLWLVWVFSAQTSSLSVVLLLLGFFWIALACWIYGKWGSPVNTRISRLISAVLVIASLGAGSYAIYTATSPAVVQVTNAEHIAATEVKFDAPRTEEWEAFSPERVAYLQSQGIPVLIDFTAKWCLVCQVNHVVLTSDVVDKKMTDLGVVKMKADWTKSDPVITEELRKFGRNSVPLYVLYGNEPQGKPQIMPQVLTAETVVQHLEKMKDEG